MKITKLIKQTLADGSNHVRFFYFDGIYSHLRE